MATVLRRRRLRLRRDRRPSPAGPRAPRSSAPRAWARATARLRAGRHARAAAARAARRVRVAVARRRRRRRAREWYDLLRAESRAAAIDPRIVDWEASVEVRTRDAPARHQRRRRRRAALPVPDARTWRSPRTPTATRRRARCNGYRGICQQGGDEVLARFGFAGSGAADRRGGARAARRAQLPERHDGRAARARPDDPADPRVDRPPAGARPHPRRRAQLRRHELRHARHVRHATATARSCSTSPSTRRGREELASYALRRRRPPRAERVT